MFVWIKLVMYANNIKIHLRMLNPHGFVRFSFPTLLHITGYIASPAGQKKVWVLILGFDRNFIELMISMLSRDWNVNSTSTA